MGYRLKVVGRPYTNYTGRDGIYRGPPRLALGPTVAYKYGTFYESMIFSQIMDRHNANDVIFPQGHFVLHSRVVIENLKNSRINITQETYDH